MYNKVYLYLEYVVVVVGRRLVGVWGLLFFYRNRFLFIFVIFYRTTKSTTFNIDRTVATSYRIIYNNMLLNSHIYDTIR